MVDVDPPGRGLKRREVWVNVTRRNNQTWAVSRRPLKKSHLRSKTSGSSCRQLARAVHQASLGNFRLRRTDDLIKRCRIRGLFGRRKKSNLVVSSFWEFKWAFLARIWLHYWLASKKKATLQNHQTAKNLHRRL